MVCDVRFFPQEQLLMCFSTCPRQSKKVGKSLSEEKTKPNDFRPKERLTVLLSAMYRCEAFTLHKEGQTGEAHTTCRVQGPVTCDITCHLLELQLEPGYCRSWHTHSLGGPGYPLGTIGLPKMAGVQAARWSGG